MKEKVDYLPLGSVVIVNGGVKKHMIIARGLQVKIDDQQYYFDYGACAYPEGLLGDQVMYFQHENINKVVFQGYMDEDNELMVSNIQKAFDAKAITRADINALKNQMEN